MNFDKLFGSVSTLPGAIGMALTLGVAAGFVWALKSGAFSNPDTSLIDAIKDMAVAVRKNTIAVKDGSSHVRDQLKQFEDSNELIGSMVDPLKNISKHTEDLAGDVHDEIIRRQASR